MVIGSSSASPRTYLKLLIKLDGIRKDQALPRKKITAIHSGTGD
jgi:hypothetical protein